MMILWERRKAARYPSAVAYSMGDFIWNTIIVNIRWIQGTNLRFMGMNM